MNEDQDLVQKYAAVECKMISFRVADMEGEPTGEMIMIPLSQLGMIESIHGQDQLTKIHTYDFGCFTAAIEYRKVAKVFQFFDSGQIQ